MEGLTKEASKYFSVISVTGPRQSGKSTLLKHLFPVCLTLNEKQCFCNNSPRHDDGEGCYL